MKNNMNNHLKEILADRKLRATISRMNHQWFFNIYFPHYVVYRSAPFHTEMFALTENEDITNLVIIAFRGSAKSTIMTLSYPIWAIVGKQRKKFVIIVGRTQRQAKQLLDNIKRELESNAMLRNDLGPFEEMKDEWGSYSLVLSWYGAKIMAVSMEQPIRGMRHMQYRPDLIICDDVEDLESVKTKEGRNKVDNWISGEILPAGDKSTRVVFIGNLLHEDSTLMRLKEKIKLGQFHGYYQEIPLIGSDDKIAWPGKYPDMESVNKEKNKIANNISWQREFMLKIIPDTDRVIHPDWIKYYVELTPTTDNNDFRYTATGIDLAISQNDSADNTAMVSANIYGHGQDLKIYILPNPINAKLTFNESLLTTKELSFLLGKGTYTKMYVEKVAYQESLIQELIRHQIPAEGVAIHGQDKRARLALTSHLVQNGTIHFPAKGCEDLISQLVNFGVEKHDDLADAFSLLINKITSENNEESKVRIRWI